MSTQTDKEADFLRRVVPWPLDGTPGVINVHWTKPDKPGMPGKPVTRLDDFISLAEWAKNHPSICKDIYFCLSLQSSVGSVVNGKTTAKRSKANALALKAVWLDIDVKAPPKGYETLQGALAAVKQFIDELKLPQPSALVGSGGGVHVYWINDTPLTPDEWRPYAEGLKAAAMKFGLRCDYGVTVDEARVLRVPGTVNNKTVPAKPVKLLGLAPTDYTFKDVLAHLAVAAPASTSGVHAHHNTPLDYTGVFVGCPHFQQAFQTHGRDSSQGLWMLDVLASTFLKDGKQIAHTLSKGYPTYTEEETNAMWDRKVRERDERGLGWPSCKAIENEGCRLCATCKHFGKIKSPLNLASSAAQHAFDGIIEQIKEKEIYPIQAVMALHKQGAGTVTRFAALNEAYAVVRYGSQVLIASTVEDEIILMKAEDFHKVFGNVRVPRGNGTIEISRDWFEWPGRRQYLDRGVVFEPGGPLDIPDDMLNLWRGFGLEPKQGDWSLMRDHILNVVCSGRQGDFDYLLKWMAYAVQHPNEPIGVAVAFRGAQGAGKGVVARTFGKFFGRHFVHIANGDQLTGRFNASLATSCAVFLDEALWAGDKKGEGVLKALITEPRLQLEAKFKDPIMVDNRLRIMVASNNDWMVPAGIGDRRWFVLDVPDTYAGTTHKPHWDALYAEIENGGAAAMFYDLRAMDLRGFDVRAVPHTAAKAQQQTLGLTGTEAWLHQIFQDGEIGYSDRWENNGLTISTDQAYDRYKDFSKQQHAFRPDTKSMWSKKMRKALGPCVSDMRQTQGNERIRSFQFAQLADCRRQFAAHLGAPEIEWEPIED